MSTPTYTYPVIVKLSREQVKRDPNPRVLRFATQFIRRIYVCGERINVGVFDQFHTKAGVTVRKHTAKRVGLPDDLIDMLNFVGFEGWQRGVKSSRADDFFDYIVADLKKGGTVAPVVNDLRDSIRRNFGKRVSTTIGESCHYWSVDGDGNHFFHFHLTSEKPLKLGGKPLTPGVWA